MICRIVRFSGASRTIRAAITRPSVLDRKLLNGLCNISSVNHKYGLTSSRCTRVSKPNPRITHNCDYHDDEAPPSSYGNSLDRGLCSERTTLLIGAEMHVQGGGPVMSRRSSSNSTDFKSSLLRSAGPPLNSMRSWLSGGIGPPPEIADLIFEAGYKRIRHRGAVEPCEILAANTVPSGGKRLGVGGSVARSQAETYCR